jgi:opacity protein-like surface antigen
MRGHSPRLATSLAFVTLVACLAPPASAAELVGIDGAMATVMQAHQSSFSGIGMRFRIRSTRLIENVEFLPNLEYWRNSTRIETFDVRTMRKDTTVGVDARYVFFNGSWEPYVGAGWAVHFLSSEVSAPSIGNAQDSMSKGGLTALAGVSLPLTTSIQNFLELKYHHVTENEQFKINWGISVLL